MVETTLTRRALPLDAAPSWTERQHTGFRSDRTAGWARDSFAGALHGTPQARVEAWIETHLGEPITLGRLCEVAGVGARCLQKSFDARRGMSPLRFVTERRLVAAHRRLSQAHPLPSVKAVALDLGFHHLGRFAQSYRRLIGESRSETLAARLRSS